MICPFRYMFKKGTSYDCLMTDCQAWSEELEGCALVLPFIELAKEIKNEATQDDNK